MSRKYFTINERNKLEVLLKENYKITRITEILKKDRATIYQEIKRFIRCLRRKGEKMKTREARGKFNIGKSIDERSEEVKTKKTFGHWEFDSEVLPREGSKDCLQYL